MRTNKQGELRDLRPDRMPPARRATPTQDANPTQRLVVRFTNNVVVSAGFWYRRSKGRLSVRRPRCVDPDPPLVRSPRSFCKKRETQ